VLPRLEVLKIYQDFKISVDYYLTNKYYHIGETNYGKPSPARFEDCESYDFSKILSAPVRVAFQDAENQPAVEEFSLKNLPMAYLLEGEFTSLFKNRFIPEGFAKEKFKDAGNGKVVVFGDGEVFQSETNLQDGRPLVLGEDPFSQTVFANKILLRNLVQYLSDPEGIIASRTRTFQIRPLSKVKIAEEKIFWQILNVISPVAVLILLGLGVWGIRKQKFSKK
jgi:gliding-associated putative ABC transporter substrate-binding component GldG